MTEEQIVQLNDFVESRLAKGDNLNEADTKEFLALLDTLPPPENTTPVPQTDEQKTYLWELIVDAHYQAGRELEELRFEALRGEERFDYNERSVDPDGAIVGPFGTQENPVRIYSRYDYRIVGCKGGNGYPHEINWISLGDKYKTMCAECGQFFKLDTDHSALHH